LAITGANAIMISSVAHRRPWLFREVHHSLSTAKLLKEPTIAEICNIMRGYLENLYVFYGELRSVRIARIHIAWDLQQRSDSVRLRQRVNRVETAASLGRRRIVDDYFDIREQVA
jgi:tRNA-dihydrouridine synthase B